MSGEVFWSDLAIVGQLYQRRWEAAGRMIAQTVTPLVQYREIVLGHYAPSLLPAVLRLMVDRRFEKHLLYHLDDFGWMGYDPPPDPLAIERSWRLTKSRFDNFAINPVSDRALRGLLEECRAHDIRVFFLLMPDHSLVRGCYRLIDNQFLPYLQELSAENHAPILDARAWVPDEELADRSHLSPRGARSFSERFGREVYRPLVEGRPLGREVLLDARDQH